MFPEDVILWEKGASRKVCVSKLNQKSGAPCGGGGGGDGRIAS